MYIYIIYTYISYVYTRLRPEEGCRFFQLYLTTQQTRFSHMQMNMHTHMMHSRRTVNSLKESPDFMTQKGFHE